MRDYGIENGHHRYNRNNKYDEENLGFDCESRLQFGLKPLPEADAAKLQSILTVNECLKWDIAFAQFWAKRGEVNNKGFRTLKFGSQGRPKKDNYKEEDEDYIDSITRITL